MGTFFDSDSRGACLPTSKLAPEMSRPILSFLEVFSKVSSFLPVLLSTDMKWVWSSPEAQKEHGESGSRKSAPFLMVRARTMNEYNPVHSDPNDYESDRAIFLLMRYCLSLVFCIIIKTSPHLIFPC